MIDICQILRQNYFSIKKYQFNPILMNIMDYCSEAKFERRIHHHIFGGRLNEICSLNQCYFFYYNQLLQPLLYQLTSLIIEFLYQQISIQYYSSMGQSVSSINQQAEDQQPQLKLNIETGKPHSQDLNPLLNWSLSEIREIYAPFRRRKGSPILTRSQFLRFIRLSRISSFHIYDCLIKTDLVNVFEVIAILVLGAYTGHIYKLQFLFNVFDLKCKKKLSFAELILMYKSIIRGYCFLTSQALPDNQMLQKFGLAMFSKADLNNDQLLEIGQIVGWLQTATQNLVMFKQYEPTTAFGKEEYQIFNCFVPYSPQQINQMTNRLNRVYTKQKLEQPDYLVLKPNLKIRKQQDQHLDMRKSWSSKIYSKPKNITNVLQRSKQGQQLNQSVDFSTTNKTSNSGVKGRNKQNAGDETRSVRVSMNKTSGKQKKGRDSIFLPQISNSISNYKNKKRFQNIIIIKGRSITKKEVFELRQYFDGISSGKKHILIEDFIENFNQEKYNHMKSVAASLFNFLDKKQNGKIQFLDLVIKLYPNLSPKHLQTISNWSDEYNKNFNMDKKIKANRQTQQYKKRILPKTCIPRIQELFHFFDENKKGFVDFKDLERVLGNACTQKQIKYLFESSDLDEDGKLTIKEFVHVLLPPDLEIQGLM